MNAEPFELDPSRYPQRLELDLTPELIDWLKKLESNSGRSVEELIIEFLDRSMHQ